MPFKPRKVEKASKSGIRNEGAWARGKEVGTWCCVWVQSPDHVIQKIEKILNNSSHHNTMWKSASTRSWGSWCWESTTNSNFNMWINHPGSVVIDSYSLSFFLVKNNKERGRFLPCSSEEKAAYFRDAASSRIYDMPDWIYVNMASVSVHKYVLGTKTFTLPTQDIG